MLKIALVAVIAMLSFSASAEEALTFKGFQIGAERNAYLAAFPKADCKEDTCFWSSKWTCRGNADCEKALQYGGVTTDSMLARFRDEKLVSVSVTFQSAQFDDLAAAMIQRFGKPDDDKTDVVQNRMGATFDNRRLGWMRDGEILRITKRSGKVDQAVVSFTSIQFLKDSAEERRDATKSRAKDL